jgi:hypothetical protein
MGKHSKKIITGDWNLDGLLSLKNDLFNFK